LLAFEAVNKFPSTGFGMNGSDGVGGLTNNLGGGAVSSVRGGKLSASELARELGGVRGVNFIEESSPQIEDVALGLGCELGGAVGMYQSAAGS
jgi:hypothetical protein